MASGKKCLHLLISSSSHLLAVKEVGIRGVVNKGGPVRVGAGNTGADVNIAKTHVSVIA